MLRPSGQLQGPCTALGVHSTTAPSPSGCCARQRLEKGGLAPGAAGLRESPPESPEAGPAASARFAPWRPLRLWPRRGPRAHLSQGAEFELGREAWLAMPGGSVGLPAIRDCHGQPGSARARHVSRASLLHLSSLSLCLFLAWRQVHGLGAPVFDVRL